MKNFTIGLMVWLSAALTLVTPAFAAPPANISYTVGVCDPSYPQRCIKPAVDGSLAVTGTLTPSGNTTVIQPTATNLNAQVVGNAASGAADTGNPVKIGGVYNSSLPGYSTGQRGNLQIGNRGSLHIEQYLGDSASAIDGTTTQADNHSASSATYFTSAYGYLFDGTTFDLARTIQGVDGTGVGVTAVSEAPSSASTAALVPVASNGASTLLVKGSAGNLYTAYATVTAATWLYVFNSTTAPTNGAVTAGTGSGNYTDCIAIASGTSGSVGGLSIPKRYSTGIYLALSSTACGTLLLATTGFMTALAQ